MALGYTNWKKQNPTGTIQQYQKGITPPPAIKPTSPNEAARSYSSATQTIKTPTATNPVVSTVPKIPSTGMNSFVKPPVQQQQTQQPQQSKGTFYNSDQTRTMRGSLWEDLGREGFSNDEITKLAGTGDLNSALDYFSGIKNASKADGGQYIDHLDPLSAANYSSILEKARGEKSLERIKNELRETERGIKADVTAKYAPEFSKVRESSTKARETDLRLAGRSAFGTATGERQTDITDKEREINQSISAQQRLEEQQAIALARGASQQEIDGINAKIQAAGAQRAQIQAELDLRQAGLEEQAVGMADEREKQVLKDSLEAAKSGLIWDNDQGSYVKDPNLPPDQDPADFDITFQTDNTGSVTQVRTNKQTGEVFTNALGSIGKGDLKEGGSKYQMQFNPLTGEQIIFDPSSGQSFNMGGPETMFFGGESQIFDPVTSEPLPTGSIFAESTPTSVSTGMEVVPDNTGLGGNCVKWARTKNPNLPFGLFDKNDKKNAIAQAGSTDWNNLRIGDTVLSGEGDVGHAFQVMGFNKDTNKIIIEEANYTPGKVTKGREISINDPILYGYVPNKNAGGQPIQVSNNVNEGNNMPITDQVQQASGRATMAGLLAMAQQMGKDVLDPKVKANILYNYTKYGILPTEDEDTRLKREEMQYGRSRDAQDDWYKKMGLELQMQGNQRQFDQNQFQMANTFRTDFDNQQAVKDFKTVQTTANEFKNIISSGVQGPGDVSLVFKFMKALDPTSVVRENEFDAAANSSGQFTPGTIWSKFNGKFKNGRFLSDQVRNDFLNLVEQSLAAKQSSYNQEMQRYQGLSSAYGVDPSQVIFNYDQSMGANTTSPFAPPQLSQPTSQFSAPKPAAKPSVLNSSIKTSSSKKTAPKSKATSKKGGGYSWGGKIL